MKDEVWFGFLAGLGLHVLVLGVCLLAQLWLPVVAVGLAQLLWLLPFLLHLRRSGLRRAAKGVAILLGVTLLVNSTCFALVMAEGFH